MKKAIAKAAVDCGIEKRQAEEAVAAVFHWLAGEVEAASWTKLVERVPDAGRLGGPHRAKGIFASMLGGAAGFVPLLAKLARAGVPKDKLRPLLTPVVTHLKDELEPELFEELKAQLPATLFRK